MAKKLPATEKLARDICWLGFNNPTKATGCRNAAQYWKCVSNAARGDYIKHAKELIWWTRKLGTDRLALAVSEHDAALTRSNQRDPA